MLRRPQRAVRTGGKGLGWLLLLGLCGGLGLGLAGCKSSDKAVQTPDADAGPTYTGPRAFRGTIGSLTQVRGSEPLLVSGVGIVAGLNNTGSDYVPENLRGWLVNEMRRQGIGSAQLAAVNPQWANLRTDEVLADPGTAVVEVFGFIPPGATKGTRFDLYIKGYERDANLRSLSAGSLWQVSLSITGNRPDVAFTQSLARGAGPVYIAPLDPSASPGVDELEYRRQGTVIAGGVVDLPRRIELWLNEPSFTRARQIADTINERYRKSPSEKGPTANAINDTVIQLDIPERFAEDPMGFVQLIRQTYPFPLEEGPEVERLMQVAADQPELRDDVVLTLRALGVRALDALRERYRAEPIDQRLIALEAGAALRDDRAAAVLVGMTDLAEASERIEVAQALSLVPRTTDTLRALRQLLSDPEPGVRIAAYEALVSNDDPLVSRLDVTDNSGVKFFIDRVSTDRPMVFVTQTQTPRIALFADEVPFKAPVFVNLWEGQLFIRTPLSVPQSIFGLQRGNVAFLPLQRRGAVSQDGEALVAEGIDRDGNTVTLVARTQQAKQWLEKTLPEQALGQDADDLFTVQARVESIEGFGGRFEVQAVSPGLDAMPLSVSYRHPQTGQMSVHRVTPTLATLAFFLAHEPSIRRPQDGLDLTFGEVVDALDQLSRLRVVEAPVQIRQSPVTEMIARAVAGSEQPAPRPDTATPPPEAGVPPPEAGVPEAGPLEAGVPQADIPQADPPQANAPEMDAPETGTSATDTPGSDASADRSVTPGNPGQGRR